MGTIVVVNAGSSSIKLALFELAHAPALQLVAKGGIDGIGTQPRLGVRDAQGLVLVEEKYSAAEVSDAGSAITRAGAWLRAYLKGAAPAAVGHRVVHGGPAYSAPQLVDDRVLAALEALVPLAPLHQPAALEPIRAIRRRFPDTPQVACFDTAFHREHPEVADRYALPEALYREGVRRYGFHGLSYEYIATRLPRIAPEIARGAVVVAHLGSGVSMCALRDGRSMDSTMGFTALDGLPTVLLVPLQFATFFLKSYFWVFVAIWLRWTLPRIRVDQMMVMCWKYLVPLALFNLLATATWMVAFPHGTPMVTNALCALAAVLIVLFAWRVLYHLRRARITSGELSFNPLATARVTDRPTWARVSG